MLNIYFFFFLFFFNFFFLNKNKVFRGCFYNLLGMIGVIPVTYRNVTYNIPIGIWVMYDYPLTPPEFVVMPTENMKIVVGKHVKPDGVITHPYLDTYASRPQVFFFFLYIYILLFKNY